VEKIMEIDEHIGCAMSGLTADARTLVEHGRVETQVVISLVYHVDLDLIVKDTHMRLYSKLR
jgi:20S proteasome alpha/beta subunit